MVFVRAIPQEYINIASTSEHGRPFILLSVKKRFQIKQSLIFRMVESQAESRNSAIISHNTLCTSVCCRPNFIAYTLDIGQSLSGSCTDNSQRLHSALKISGCVPSIPSVLYTAASRINVSSLDER